MYIEFKEGRKFAEKNADISDNIESFTDCGYLIEDDEVIVDIDHVDKNVLKKLIDKFDIKTQTVWTERGCHFYFRKPVDWTKRAKGIVPFGFEVEYKTKENTPNGITIKRYGEVREIDNEGARQVLPYYFRAGFGANKYHMLQGLGEGDGRNNELYKLKARIIQHPDHVKILDFINKFIFSEPLNDKEFNEVARYEDFAGGKDQEALTAKTIQRKHKIVKYNGDLYFYDNDCYQCDKDLLNRLVYRYCPDVKTSYIDEVLKQIDYRCEVIPSDKVFEVKFNNGILYKGEFYECNFTDFTPYTINVDYDPNAEPVKEVDDYLNLLTDGDEDYKKLIGEILGHILITDKEVKRLHPKFFIFVGDGGNGKGTLLQVIKAIVNKENCSALSIQNMADEKYFNQMSGRLVNLGDDVQDEALNTRQLKHLKNITSCDPVEMRKLYENSRTVELVITLIFTSNHVLKSFEKGDSYKRRVMWLPMYNKPTKKEKDFISKITTPKALKYWVRLAVEGYNRLYKNDTFTTSAKIEQFNAEYHYENDSTVAYVESLLDEEIEGKKPVELYQDYELWAEDNGESVLSKKAFNQTVRTLRGYSSKQVWNKAKKKPQRVYVKDLKEEKEEDNCI